MLRPRSMGLLLALITLVVYLPVTANHFINFDDPEYVTENPFVSQGLSWTGFKWAFAEAHESNWHPLTWLAHMLDCDLFHLNPAGHHLVNALIHSVNAALVFALLFRLTQKLWPAALVAALFAWHPLHVESVAWVAELKDVLSTCFTLLALISYTSYAQKRSKVENSEPNTGGTAVAFDDSTNQTSVGGASVPASHERLNAWPSSAREDARPTGLCHCSAPDSRSAFFDYFLALFFFACALLSKAMPVTLPCVLLLLDFWPLKRWSLDWRQLKKTGWLLVEKIPFIAFSLAVCVITILSQHHAELSLASVPLGLRLENVVTAYAGYLGKMIWPLHLAIFYPYPGHIAGIWVGESAAFLLGISALAWLERKANPYLLVGWLWFLITLLPVIGIVQVGGQSMADRYTYFPSVGIFLAVGFCLQTLAERFLFLKRWLVIAAIFVLGILVSLTEKQISYWYDSESLFRHALQVESSATAHISLGRALRDKNQRTAAMLQYIIAWRINPDSVLANANIAGVLAEDNKPEMAAIYYARAVKKNDWLPSVFQNYGRVLVTLKRYDDAMKQFAAAVKIDPTKAAPHFLMGKLWLQEGRDTNAVKELLAALNLEPGNLEIMTLAASVMAASEDSRARDKTQAYALASEAVKLTGRRSPAALDVLAMSYAEMGQFDKAMQTQEQAIKLAKDNDQKTDLGLLQKRLETYKKHQPWRESFKND